MRILVGIQRVMELTGDLKFPSNVAQQVALEKPKAKNALQFMRDTVYDLFLQNEPFACMVLHLNCIGT